jgi:HK97 family phage prohead protease
MERRFFQTEIRAEVEGDGSQAPQLNGYAAVFDQLSVLLYGMFREKIDRGAFAASLTDDVRALWNHDTNLPLGRTKAGTLRMAEDAHGLRVEIDVPNTQAGRDALESIGRGDVDQMSFGFEVLEDAWDQDASGMLIRTLRKVKLFDVSPVTFPAYQGTEVSARAHGPLGDMPTIPEQFRAAAGRGDAEHGQALVAMRRRRLALIDKLTRAE